MRNTEITFWLQITSSTKNIHHLIYLNHFESSLFWLVTFLFECDKAPPQKKYCRLSILASRVPQAQARMQESSQKVDLLSLSLERRLSELPRDHPKHAVIREELFVGTPPSSGMSKKMSSSSSSFLFKPASLTGCSCYIHRLFISCWYNTCIQRPYDPAS